MPTEYRVNDAVVAVPEDTTPREFFTALERDGWHVEGVRVNGEPATLAAIVADLPTAPRALELVEIVARVPLPAGSAAASAEAAVAPSAEPGVETELDAQSAPADLEALAREIESTLPRFRQLATDLGNRFSEGRWRDGLTTLVDYLTEFRTILDGARFVYEPGPDLDAIVGPAQQVIADLDDAIRRQSWVDVADLLSYELDPLLETWHERVTAA